MKNYVIFFLCFLTITANSQITFTPGIPYALTSAGPGAILVEDIDNDGDLDMATSETGTGYKYFYWFLNDGENFAQEELSFGLWSGQNVNNYNDLYYSHYAFGDYDGDGDSDFIIHENVVGLGPSGDDNFVVMESLGNGEFNHLVPGDGSNPGQCDGRFHFYPYDFNQDGKTDLIRKPQSSCNNTFFRIGLSTADLMDIDDADWDWTSTQEVGFQVNDERWRVVDLNDDDIQDCIALTNDKVFFYPGEEEGFFQSTPFTIYDGVLSSYECADWDGDGLTDLITIDNTGSLGIVKHFQGNTFYEWESIPSPSGASINSFASDDVSASDFDNDGDIDLIGLNTAGELVVVPNESGELGEEVVLSSSGSETYTIVDFNQDGLVDVISKTGTAIVYFLNESETIGCTDDTACNFNPSATSSDDSSCIYPPYPYDCDLNCLNDLDANGICDEFESGPSFNPDANGDGVIDVTDLLSIIPLFGMPFEADPCIGPE